MHVKIFSFSIQLTPRHVGVEIAYLTVATVGFENIYLHLINKLKNLQYLIVDRSRESLYVVQFLFDSVVAVAVSFLAPIYFEKPGVSSFDLPHPLKSWKLV